MDITFTNFAGGIPGSAEFNADAYLDGLDELEKLGVNWVQVAVPGTAWSTSSKRWRGSVTQSSASGNDLGRQQFQRVVGGAVMGEQHHLPETQST